MKKILSLVLALALATTACATEVPSNTTPYEGNYVLVRDERIELAPFISEPEKIIKFYLIISEEEGIFLQFDDIVSQVDDYVYLGDELYISSQDILEILNANEALSDIVNFFYSASRFEIAE